MDPDGHWATPPCPLPSGETHLPNEPCLLRAFARVAEPGGTLGLLTEIGALNRRGPRRAFRLRHSVLITRTRAAYANGV
jgi:hypothetical protein